MVGSGVTYLAMSSVNPTAEKTVDTTPALSQNPNLNQVVTKYEIVSTDSPVVAIADKVSPSVVGIVATYSINDFFFGSRQSGSEGSGIIIDAENGYVVTNNHVIEKSLSTRSNQLLPGAQIEVILPREPDKRYPATVVGRDSETDIALLKIEAKNLVAYELGDSDDLKVGELLPSATPRIEVPKLRNGRYHQRIGQRYRLDQRRRQCIYADSDGCGYQPVTAAELW